MDKQQVVAAVDNLNKAYPNGWQSGDPACDALTVFLYHNLQIMTQALFAPRGQR